MEHLDLGHGRMSTQSLSSKLFVYCFGCFDWTCWKIHHSRETVSTQSNLLKAQLFSDMLQVSISFCGASWWAQFGGSKGGTTFSNQQLMLKQMIYYSSNKHILVNVSLQDHTVEEETLHQLKRRRSHFSWGFIDNRWFFPDFLHEQLPFPAIFAHIIGHCQERARHCFSCSWQVFLAVWTLMSCDRGGLYECPTSIWMPRSRKANATKHLQ